MKHARRSGGLAIVAITLLALLIPAQTSHAAVNSAVVTLNIATVNNPQMIDMEGLTSNFEKLYPNIKVNYITLPENDVRQKVTADVATGGGQYDLVTVGNYEVPNWAKNGWIVSLGTYFDQLSAADARAYDLNDVLGKVRLAFTYKNNLYALPFYGESAMTFYNKKLFAAAGLTMPLHPTWDQVAAFAAKLNNPSKNQYGICLRGLPGWGEFGAPLNMVINDFGGSWFNMKWEPQLTSPATMQAVKFYINLVKNYGEPGATTAGFTECETNFAQGRVAMWVDATSASGLITDPKNSKVASDVGFAYAPKKVLPVGNQWLWSWSLTIEASSRHKDAAFKFLTWATSKDYIKLVGAKKGWGNIPPGTRASSFNNANYRAAAPYWKIIYDSMQTADPTHPTSHPVPYTGLQFVGIPEFQAMGDQVTQDLAAALSGSTTVEAALQLAQQQVTRTMRQAGYIH